MHPECVEEKARILMSRLGPTLGMHGGILAGGTGLALHLGHRIADDLEFFAQQPFRPSEVLEELRTIAGAVEQGAVDETMVTMRADGAVMTLQRSHVRLLEPTTHINGCDVAGVLDIAAMKLMAIVQDGVRSDFVDLYSALQTVPFRRVARQAIRLYETALVDPLTVGKALAWFVPAEEQSDPVYVGTPVAWGVITAFFRSSVRQFVLDLDAEGCAASDMA
jgi:hypothetical protein